jgi:hypothetical protein
MVCGGLKKKPSDLDLVIPHPSPYIIYRSPVIVYCTHLEFFWALVPDFGAEEVPTKYIKSNCEPYKQIAAANIQNIIRVSTKVIFLLSTKSKLR